MAGSGWARSDLPPHSSGVKFQRHSAPRVGVKDTCPHCEGPVRQDKAAAHPPPHPRPSAQPGVSSRGPAGCRGQDGPSFGDIGRKSWETGRRPRDAQAKGLRITLPPHEKLSGHLHHTRRGDEPLLPTGVVSTAAPLPAPCSPHTPHQSPTQRIAVSSAVGFSGFL